MTIEIKCRDDVGRLWEYYLRKKYKSKSSIKELAKLAIIETVAKQAKKEVKELSSRVS